MAVDNPAKQVSDILLAALVVELDKAGDAENFCAKAIYPGDAAPLDYGTGEDCGGMAWVRLAGAFPTAAFPSPVQTVDNCEYTLGFNMEMALMRPSPLPEEFGRNFELPGDDEHITASHNQFDDMMLMHRAVKAARREIDFVILGTYTPLGPVGGVVGGSWTLTAGMDL